jgi:tetratricopeptide (TPR) repeat protein
MHRFLVSLVLTLSVGCAAARHHATMQAQGESFRYELAELYVAKGASEAAVPLLQRILAEHPEDPRAHVLYGTVLRDQGLLPQAEAQLRAALKISAARADAHAALAILLDLTDRHAEALRHHRRAARLEPGNAAYRNNLGFSLLSAGEAEDAIGPLEQALALDPGLPQAYANLGFAYGRAGRLDDAERTLRSGLGEAAALYDLALIHDDRDEADQADALRERAYAIDPDLRPEETP